MFRTQFVPAVVLAVSSLLAAGCSGGKGPDGAVSGKVVLSGQTVAGQVVFVGPNQKEMSALIKPDGTYQLTNLVPGEYQVLVKGVQGGPPVVPGAKLPTDAPAREVPPGVVPPAKYAQSGNGLKFKVTGGEQTYDIELTK